MEILKDIHFTGIGGSGMSALAQLSAMDGRSVTGSDRDFDNGKNQEFKAALEKLGIKIYPQDGCGITANTSELVVSTAVEDTNPEIAKAKSLGVKITHRSECLAGFVERHKTIAVGGTSGKSTVVAMIFTILEEAGLCPGVITGGPLVSLKERGLIGNAWKGKGEILVIEADESDGTITKYKPAIGLILNITKDHKEVSEIKKIFKFFASNSGAMYLNADAPELSEFRGAAKLFGLAEAGLKQGDITQELFRSVFILNGVEFIIPAPGLYNVENALASIKVCLDLGVSLKQCAEGLKNFRGVQRRFELAGEANGITVVDDYAHNPAKISAVLGALKQDPKRRIIAVYQPHGYAPTRLLRKELVEVFVNDLRAGDILFMPEIYYAGGTVAKDISSRDLIEAISLRGREAYYFKNRADILPKASDLARPGDIFIVIGARDWTLSNFAKDLYKRL